MNTRELAENILDSLLGQGILSTNPMIFREDDWIPIIEEEISHYLESNNDSLDRGWD